MNYIIFDLEATCWEDRSKTPNEIIEIGAVKINSGKIVSEFSIFIKPIIHKELSKFCTELTTITQEDVDNAVNFPEALKEFTEWIGEEDFYLCSWGFYDKTQLNKDCELHKLDKITKNHISLKHQYNKIKNIKKRVGVKRALSIENLKFEGTHHRGIDDARNIAKIFLNNVNEWKY